MSILAKARADWRKLSQSAFDLELTFNNNQGQTAVIKGIGTRHSLSMDTDGMAVNQPNNHVSFCEALIQETNPLYVIRQPGSEEVQMTGHRVSFEDSTGTVHEHIIKQAWPDQTVGVVVCILENEEDSYL